MLGKWRELASHDGDDHQPIDLGHRGFFRNDKELVYVNADASVSIIDVSKD